MTSGEGGLVHLRLHLQSHCSDWGLEYWNLEAPETRATRIESNHWYLI